MRDIDSTQLPAAGSFATNDHWIYPEAYGVTHSETVALNGPDDWYAVMRLRPAFASSVTDSLGAFFKSLLPDDKRILGVYWMFEGETLRVWTSIEEADFALETPIYDAQMRFIQKMSDLECDFAVIYRQGRDIGQLLPNTARVVA